MGLVSAVLGLLQTFSVRLLTQGRRRRICLVLLTLAVFPSGLLLPHLALRADWFMGQGAKSQALRVRKVQVPVQEDLARGYWGGLRLPASWPCLENTAHPCFLRARAAWTWPGHWLVKMTLNCHLLAFVLCGSKCWDGGEKWSCPGTQLLGEDHQVGPRALSNLQPDLGCWGAVLGAKPPRGVQELMITACSPWTLPHQAPSLASCYLELCL